MMESEIEAAAGRLISTLYNAPDVAFDDTKRWVCEPSLREITQTVFQRPP